jgi:hypothetical protein
MNHLLTIKPSSPIVKYFEQFSKSGFFLLVRVEKLSMVSSRLNNKNRIEKGESFFTEAYLLKVTFSEGDFLLAAN